MGKKGRGVGACSTRPVALKGATPRLQKALVRLLSRQPFKSRKDEVAKVVARIDFSNVTDSMPLYMSTNAYIIDGDTDADAEEAVLHCMCRSMSKSVDPDGEFALVFGEPLGSRVKCFADECRLMSFDLEKKRGGEEDVDDDCGDDCGDASVLEDGESEGMPADMRTPFARKLAKMVAEAKEIRLSGSGDRPVDAAATVGTSTSVLGPGSEIMTYNLKSRPEMNGCKGVILRKKEGGKGAQGDRFAVRLHDGAEFALKRENLLVTKGVAQPKTAREHEEEKESDRSICKVGLDAPARIVKLLNAGLREFGSTPNPSKPLRHLIREAAVRRGNMNFLVCLEARHTRTLEAVDFLLIQMDAALVVWCTKGRLWRRCPDALLLRGVAYFLRSGAAEAATDLSAALACSPQRWVSNEMRPLAETILKQTRAEGVKPTLGVWEQLVDCFDGDVSEVCGVEQQQQQRAPGPRVGPTSCTVGTQLYLFGGLATEGSDAHMLRVVLHALGRFGPNGPSVKTHQALDDFYVFDHATKLWRRLPSAPPSRGFAHLAHDKASDSLLLYSGRTIWRHNDGSARLSDMWRFDLKAGAWDAVKGNHPKNMFGAHAIHDGGWFHLDTRVGLSSDEEPLPVILLRYDLLAGTWAYSTNHLPSPGSPPPPSMAGPAAGWGQDGKLFCFSSERRQGNSTVTVWAVSLGKQSWGQTWEPHVVIGPTVEGSGKLNEKRFRGSLSFNWVEASAAFDEVSRKAYVFGGWSEDLFSHSVMTQTGRPTQLEGKYFRTLVEVDVDNMCMKAVEMTATADAGTAHGCGPEERGFALVSACTTTTTVDTAADEEERAKQPPSSSSSVVVGYGYTTFEAALGVFSNVRSFGDVWECKLLGEGVEPPPTPQGAFDDEEQLKHLLPPTATGPANTQTLTRPLPVGAEFAPSGVKRATTEQRTNKGSLCHEARAQIFRFDPGDVFDEMRSLICNRDPLRKLVGDLVPAKHRGVRGGFVVKLVSATNGHPATPEEFFTKEHFGPFHTEAQIRKRFRDLGKYCEETEAMMMRFDPHNQFFFIGVGAESNKPVVTKTGACYVLYAAFFGRFEPGRVYISERHQLETGELRASKDVEEFTVKENGPARVQTAAVEVCSNKGDCPNMEKRLSIASALMAKGVAMEEATKKLPKLNKCSGCLVAVYCCSACQLAHWPSHKDLCKDVRAKRMAFK